MVRDNIFQLIASLDIESIDHLWLLLRYNESDQLPVGEHLSPGIKTIIYQTNRFDQEELAQFKLLLCGACIGIRKQSKNRELSPTVSVMPNQKTHSIHEIIQSPSYLLNLDTDFIAEAIKGGLMSKKQLETLMNALADSISYS
jgi:hypothetical protein